MKTALILLSVLSVLAIPVLGNSYTNSYYIITFTHQVGQNQMIALTDNGYDAQRDSAQHNVLYVKGATQEIVPAHLIADIQKIQYVNAQGQVINVTPSADFTQPNFFKIFFSFLI